MWTGLYISFSGVKLVRIIMGWAKKDNNAHANKVTIA